MRIPRSPIAATTLSISTGLLACTDGATVPVPAEDHVVLEPPTSPIRRSEMPPARSHRDPGPAYLFVANQPYMLDDGAWAPIPDADGVPFLGADGHAYLLSGEGLARLDAAKAIPVVEIDTNVAHLVGAGVSSSGGVALLARSCCGSQMALIADLSGRWEAVASPIHYFHYEQVLPFDDQDRLWNWTPYSVELTEWRWPARWPETTPLDLPRPWAKLRFVAAPGGPVFGFADDVAFRLTPDPAAFPLPIEAPSRIAVSTNGSLALTSPETCELVRVAIDGTESTVTTTRLDLLCDAGLFTHELTFDGRDRIWVATSAGVAVVAPDGPPHELALGSLGSVQPRSVDLVVVGAGPEQLPPASPVPRLLPEPTIDLADLAGIYGSPDGG